MAETDDISVMRPVIVISLVVGLAVAIAPWFSGGQEPIAMLISAAALLMCTLLAWRQPLTRLFKIGPLGITYTLFIGFSLLSLLWSANRYSTGLWIIQWSMAGLAFRLAYIVAGEEGGRRLLLRFYLAIAGLFCVSALWIYMTSSYDRLTGFFYWPNPAAAYLIPAIIICVDRIRIESERKYLLWSSAGCLFLALFMLTDSRAASLVLALVLMMYLFISVTSRAFWFRFWFTILLGIGLSYGLFLLSTITIQHSQKIPPGSRIAEVAEGDSESVSDRINYVESAITIWLHHPLIGTGAGTYGDLHPQYQKRVVSASVNAHNLYIQTLSELGVIGGFLLIALLGWLFFGVLRGLVKNTELMYIALSAMGLLIHFGLDIDASYPALLILASVLLGLVYRQSVSERVAMHWWWPVLAALLIFPVASLYQSSAWASKASIEQSNGDYPLAAAEYTAAHRGILYNPTYFDAEGIDYYTVGATKEAQTKNALSLAYACSIEAERLAPHDGQNYELEGRVLTLQGHLRLAEIAFRTSLLLDPYDHPEYALDLASVQLLEQEPDAALVTAKNMVRQYPDAVVTNRELDTTLRPTLADLEALIGNVYYDRDNMSAAKAAAHRALHYDRTSLQAEALAHQLAI